MFDKEGFINYAKIERLLVSAPFTAKFDLLFYLDTGKTLFRTFSILLTLKQLFLKTKPFSKTEVLFLVESTKILNATFP